MIKKKVKVFLCTVLLIASTQIRVEAETGGGQVSSKSGITFYQNEEPTTKEPTPTANPKNQTGSNSKTFLPKTGEIKNNGSFYGWGLLLMTVVGMVLLKRRRKYEK